MCWLRSFLVVFTLLLGLLSYGANGTSRLLAQERHCDPDLKPVGDNGYKPRGDRCEGVYIKEVGNTQLLVASLTESFEDFNPDSQPLQVEWGTVGNTSVHLRAYALRNRTYYRMDSIRPASSTFYTWLPELLNKLNLRRRDIGVVAWTSFPVGNTTREVYLPLKIKQQGVKQQAPAAKSRNYQLVLLPGAELAEVYIGLAPVKPDGSLGTFIKKDKALGYGYYPAGLGVTISISDLQSSGIYYLEAGATLKAGGSSKTSIWLYHHSN